MIRVLPSDPRIAEELAGGGGAIDLARRDVVAHAVGLVVGEPERSILRIELEADGVAHAGRIDLAPAAVERIEPDDPADAGLGVQRELVARRDVERLAERDVQLAVLSDAARARAVVERFLLDRDQLSLRNDLDDRDVGAFVEELGGGKVQDAVVLDDDQKSVCVQHTPFGTLKLTEGANALTSSATPSPLRSVTAHTVVLRVPTNSMLVDGATAMCRASGTSAYSSILKPGGSLIFFRFSRIASALRPVCGIGGNVEIRGCDLELL